MTTDPLVRLHRRRQLLGQIVANGGYYVTDCQPWAIKADCTRQDCPMRTQALPPEAQPHDLLLQCDPPGELADLLIRLQAAAFFPSPKPTQLNDGDNEHEPKPDNPNS